MNCNLTHEQREALAILRTGGSFDDAAKHAGLSVEQVQEVWTTHREQR